MSRDIKLVTLALFLWGSGEGLFVYILPLYMEQLGATPQEVGAVLGLAAFLAACSFIPGGLLADRFDAKKIMIWGWAMGAVASLGMGLAPTWQVFVPWILIYNISAYCIPAINTYIAEASGDIPLEHTITVTFAGYAAGSIVSPFIGGRLAEALGTPPLFIIGAALFAVSFFIALERAQSCGAFELHQTRAINRCASKSAAAAADPVVCAPVLCLLRRPHRHGAARELSGHTGLEHRRCELAGRNRLTRSARWCCRWRWGAWPRDAVVAACSLGRLLVFLGDDPVCAEHAGAACPARGRLTSCWARCPRCANCPMRKSPDKSKRSLRGTVLGMNETIFSLARSLAALLAGALFALNPRGPFIAAHRADPDRDGVDRAAAPGPGARRVCRHGLDQQCDHRNGG